MSSTVRLQLNYWSNNLNEGDVLVTNHPSAGGSHLPKITIITPVFDTRNLVQFNAEEAVIEMLKSVAARVSSNSAKGEEGDLVVIGEEDFMDCGSIIHLKLTIDPKKGEASFDFSGTSPKVIEN
ncbi:5-oxoprolinase [Olea europaea subsp. europaea]|uniref:5-oxoprolinase n=1 Tax=Olea europaea subsp. europaea TaxID=158383 RepID=A0A8S0U9B8_OLEEU|nr:5-oxoprolinase [Olea europaea subsp. europaea]